MVRLKARYVVWGLVLMTLGAAAAWWLWPAAPAPKYVFHVGPPPAGKLERPRADIPTDSRVGDVALTLDGQSGGAAPVVLRRGEKVKVGGQILSSPAMTAYRNFEHVGLALAFRSSSRLGWSVIGESRVDYQPGPMKDGGPTVRVDGEWTVPNVEGELMMLVLVNISETGKLRPFYTAKTIPVMVR